MAEYYKNVYTSLRSAMIDREMGDKPEEAVLIDFVSAKVALKPLIPSSALLIAYSMLYYPNWLNDGRSTDHELVPIISRPIEDFVGGVENYRFPLLFNINMGMIAVAVGVYAKLWTVQYSRIMQTIMISPNIDHPLVKETQRQIKQERLDYTQARKVFIELMSQEEYSIDMPLADDYIANASFIQEASARVDDSGEYAKQVQEIDPSYFRGEE